MFRQVSGQVAVMAINALLTKVIFDANPTHEFYVEESFPLDWMYPYLTPFGIIMKINRQPLSSLTEDILDRDHQFWRQFSKRLTGDIVDYDTPIKKSKKVAVVGAGNVAMDSVRTAIRLGADEVYLVYRRSEQEMPARIEEIERAKEEGAIFKLLTNPVRIIGNDKGWVTSMECIRMELGEPDDSGRRRPVPVKGSEFIIEVDSIIMALGTNANPLLPQATPGLTLNKWGYITTDEETCATSIKGVYAGGDIVTGSATVILAMGAGRKAARAIDKYLSGNT